jgi:hypothetical protein
MTFGIGVDPADLPSAADLVERASRSWEFEAGPPVVEADAGETVARTPRRDSPVSLWSQQTESIGQADVDFAENESSGASERFTWRSLTRSGQTVDVEVEVFADSAESLSDAVTSMELDSVLRKRRKKMKVRHPRKEEERDEAVLSCHSHSHPLFPPLSLSVEAQVQEAHVS